MEVQSPAFRHAEVMPVRYTCDGEGVSPPINWSGVPENTKSFAVICDDPDAPSGVFTHWLLFNIPADRNDLPEGVPPDDVLEDGASHGLNSSRVMGYTPPCPPKGVHRYFFKVYALDSMLHLKPGVTKERVQEAMGGHILADAELLGNYGGES